MLLSYYSKFNKNTEIKKNDIYLPASGKLWGLFYLKILQKVSKIINCNPEYVWEQYYISNIFCKLFCDVFMATFWLAEYFCPKN